jgi:hypothetical protein
MATNKNWHPGGDPAGRLSAPAAGRGPSARAMAYGLGGEGPAGGQAARSEYGDLNKPLEGGLGYEATVLSEKPAGGSAKGSTVSRRTRPAPKSCAPGHGGGSDYFSAEPEVRSRPVQKP